MFFNDDRDREMESTLDYYIGQMYTESALNDVNFRKITEEEYQNVPNKYRNTNNHLVLPFFLMVGDIALSGCGIVLNIIDAINHVENAVLGIFVSFMLGLFGFVFTYIAYDNRKGRKITRDTLVAAGEVAEMRNANYTTKGHTLIKADYIIALPGCQKLIMVNETSPFYCGTAVLVYKSDSSKYHLVSIPTDAADFGYYAPDHTAELKRMDLSATYDYSKFKHVDILETPLERVTDGDYEVIPRKFKSINPLNKGVYSLLWLVFTTITLILSFYCVKYHLEHNANFLPICAALICELCIQMLMNSIAFKKSLIKNRTVTLDCIVAKVISDTGNNRLTLVIPDKQQFVEGVPFENMIINKIPTNIPVRLYFDFQMTPLVKYYKIL